ncbi:MAG: hypothetical protein GYB67_12350 [Chloroflexi bacterium]|nr:hypothetical protein [Chloroflexota bacterium]
MSNVVYMIIEPGDAPGLRFARQCRDAAADYTLQANLPLDPPESSTAAEAADDTSAAGGGVSAALTDAVKTASAGADHVVVVLSPRSTRPFSLLSAALKHAIDAGKSPIPVLVEACIPPIQLITTPYLNAITDPDAAIQALIQAWGAPSAAHSGPAWIAPGGLLEESDTYFTGRDDLLDAVFEAIADLEGRGSADEDIEDDDDDDAADDDDAVYDDDGDAFDAAQVLADGVVIVVGGRQGGKTDVLREFQFEASDSDRITLYADCAAHHGVNPHGTVIAALWQQIMDQNATARALPPAIAAPEASEQHLDWLYTAILAAAEETPVVLLLDNLQLDTGAVLQTWLEHKFGDDDRVLTVVTYTPDPLQPPPESLADTRYLLKPLNAVELEALFAPPDSTYGIRLFDLSDGLPALVQGIIAAWIEDGAVADTGDGLEVNDPDAELPDVWYSRVEARLTAALEACGLNDEYELEDLLDWLTCAAVEGVVFSETALFAATGDDVTPEHAAALLKALAADDHPLVQPLAAESEAALPIDTPCWEFRLAGLRELVLYEAMPADIAFYGEAILGALETAAGDNWRRLRGHLLPIARLALDAEIRAQLSEEDQPDDAETNAYYVDLGDSAVLDRLLRYLGADDAAALGEAVDREAEVQRLRLRLNVVPEERPEVRWPLLQALGMTLYRSAPDDETAAAFRAAREQAAEAGAAPHVSAYLHYWEARVTPQAGKLELLAAGWQSLPQSIGDEPPETFTPDMALNARDGSTQLVIALLFTGLGDYYRDAAEREVAEIYYERSLPIFNRVRDRRGEALALMSLATLRRTADEADEQAEAVELQQRAVNLLREHGSPAEVRLAEQRLREWGVEIPGGDDDDLNKG